MRNKNVAKQSKIGSFSLVWLPLMVVGASMLTAPASAHRGTSAPIDETRYSESVSDEPKYSDIPDPTPYIGYGAEEADYFEQPSFVVDYFQNLTEHYPTNNSGNCTYTAAAMLLSYYDVYWNRYIVPDQFNDLALSEVLSAGDDAFSSPGIIDYYAPVWTKQNPEMREPDPNLDSAEYIRAFEENKREAYTIYIDHMLARTSDNLISKLYQIALDPAIGAYDFAVDPSPSLSLGSLASVLNAYFWLYNFSEKIQLNVVSYYDFMYGNNTEQEMRKELRYEAVQRLQAGQPLILSGKLSRERYGKGRDGGGNQNGAGRHSVVAYAYDSQWDYIVGHMGWKTAPEYTKALLDLEFESFDAFAYLEISPDLEFTPRNYRFNDHGPIAATDLCSHVHGNYVAVDYEDNFYHALQCVCGHSEYLPHENVLRQYDEAHHAYVCSVCGHERLVEHSFFRVYGVGWICNVCGKVVDDLPPGVLPWPRLHD